MTFQDAYDALLGRWGLPVEQLELPDEFGTTHVNACGPADGPPVILLPGYGATSPVWFAVAPRLAERYRVYAIDLIVDAGRSTNTGQRPKTPDNLHTWLTNSLDKLGLDQAALCGHSYGSWIALTYTLAHPDRVRRLALIDPTDSYLGLRLPYVLRDCQGSSAPRGIARRRSSAGRPKDYPSIRDGWNSPASPPSSPPPPSSARSAPPTTNYEPSPLPWSS